MDNIPYPILVLANALGLAAVLGYAYVLLAIFTQQ